MSQTPKQALADIEKGKAKPLYYLYGEEPFKTNEFIEKAAIAMFGQGSDLTFCPITRDMGSTPKEASIKIGSMKYAIFFTTVLSLLPMAISS